MGRTLGLGPMLALAAHGVWQLIRQMAGGVLFSDTSTWVNLAEIVIGGGVPAAVMLHRQRRDERSAQDFVVRRGEKYQ